MATSSIFEQIKLTDPKVIERFIEALEASERDAMNRPKPSAPIIPTLTDHEEIRKLMSKRKKKSE